MENEFAARSCKSSEVSLNSMIALHFQLCGLDSHNSHALFWHVANAPELTQDALISLLQRGILSSELQANSVGM